MKDEDLDFYRVKVRRIAEGRDTDHGPWAEAFAAKEVQPIIQRLDAAEADLNFFRQSLRWAGDGWEWSPRDWDYRIEPSEAAHLARKACNNLGHAENGVWVHDKTGLHSCDGGCCCVGHVEQGDCGGCPVHGEIGGIHA